MTLVEVMIAAIVFTIAAMSITALFGQNNQMAMRLRYRTSATNAALNILEQVRVLDFAKINSLYSASAPTLVTQAYVRVIVADPTAPNLSGLASPYPNSTTAPGFGVDPIPAKFRNVDLVVNARETVIKNSTWTSYPSGLPLDTTTSARRMPLKFWLTLKYNEAVSGSTSITATGQVFEIVLVYSWQQPGSTKWESGTVRVVLPNPNPAVIRT